MKITITDIKKVRTVHDILSDLRIKVKESGYSDVFDIPKNRVDEFIQMLNRFEIPYQLKNKMESKIEILKRMIREEVRKVKLKESTNTSWHDSKSRTIQVGDQLIYSKGKPKKIQVVKELDNGGLQYRFVERFRLGDDLFTIPPAYKKTHSGFLTIISNESALKEDSFNDEVDELATNLIDYLGTELPEQGWKTNPRIFNWFKENGIKINTPIAQDIYRRALELNQDNEPKSRKYLDN